MAEACAKQHPMDSVAMLGLVVPKRHAPRAVTRNLIRRQMRAAGDRHRQLLSSGAWVLRLRAPFDPKTFASAASASLRQAARHELNVLFATAGRMVARRDG